MTPRLWVLQAKSAPVAVILRRGPSRQVQMIRWDQQDDSFLCGQWFKGRVYERRCDLSPDGKYLLSFAANHKPPHGTWTAISRPPYFTALALWPKGDCWNGGGWFLSKHSFVLNHGADQAALAEGFALKKLRRAGLAKWGGEDATVWWNVLERDGWTRVQDAEFEERKRGWRATVPERWIKPHGRFGLTLEMNVVGIGGLVRGWYDLRYRVFSAKAEVIPETALDWADWDHGGDLVYARDGKIFRRSFRKKELQSKVELADFTAEKFRNVAPSLEATKW
jgi:hypothetical protein